MMALPIQESFHEVASGMSEAGPSRKLAAILAADVAGYSRLMALDDSATVRALNESRAVFQERIEQRGGQVIDMVGDSVLAEFRSAVEAMQCAMEVQVTLQESNRQVPAEKRMLFRIGINVGDVIAQQDGTIYGDGVNIAARLESIGEPGGICISGTVYDQVKGRLEAIFEFLGRATGQEHPGASARVPGRLDAQESDAAAGATAIPALALPDKPSIAVLPFDNMSGDPEQEFFADGVVEAITATLSQDSFVLRNRAQLCLPLQRPCRRRFASRQRAGGPLRAGGQCAEGGQLACASRCSLSTRRAAHMSGQTVSTVRSKTCSTCRTESLNG